MRKKWQIQAVLSLHNHCAFVVLSAKITFEDVWEGWRKKNAPKDWKVLTKPEHTARTFEYIQLIEEEKRKDEKLRCKGWRENTNKK